MPGSLTLFFIPHLPVPYTFETGGLATWYIGNWELGSKYVGNWNKIWLSHSWHQPSKILFCTRVWQNESYFRQIPFKTNHENLLQVQWACLSSYTTWQVLGGPKLPRTPLEVWWGLKNLTHGPKDSKFFTFSREPKFSQDDIIINWFLHFLGQKYIYIYYMYIWLKKYMPSWQIIPYPIR